MAVIQKNRFQQLQEQEISLIRNPSVAVQAITDAACGRLPATDGTVYLTWMAARDLCAGIRVLDHWMEPR